MAIENKNMGAIDILKLAFSLVIVAGHTNYINIPNTFIGEIVGLIFSSAVSFFFVATGYLLFYRMGGSYGNEDNLATIYRSIIKMIKRYFVWTILGLPFAIYEFVKEKTGPFVGIVFYIRDLIFRGEHYLGAPTWFILSSIYALIIIYFLLKKTKSELLTALIIPVSLIIGIVVRSHNYTGVVLGKSDLWQYIYCNTIGMYGGRIFEGLWMIPLGMIIAKYVKIKKWYIPWIGLVIALLLGQAMCSELRKLFISSFIFMSACTIPLASSKLLICMRRVSTIVYFAHMFYVPAFLQLFHGEYQPEVFYYTVLCSVLTGITVHIFIEKEILSKWMKLLL